MPIYRLPVVTSSLPLQKLNSSSSNQDGRRHHPQHPQQHYVEQHPTHTKHHLQQQHQHQQHHQHLDPNENIIVKRSNSIPIQTTVVNHSTSSSERVSIIPSDESIVEREIRLQLEREAEIALLHGGDMRSGRSAMRRQTDAANHSQGDYVAVVEAPHSPEMRREPRGTPRGTPMGTSRGAPRGSAAVDVEDGGRKAIINQYSKVGESLIVRELVEQKRREEELRHRWKNTGMLIEVDDGRGGGGSSSSEDDLRSSRPGSGETPVSPHAIPTANIRAIIRVQPFEDPDEDPRRMFITPRLETVIEREIRVQRQREGSLRRARGYPLQAREDRLKQVEVGLHHPPPSAVHRPGHPGEQRGALPPGVERRSVDGDASDEVTVQRFATNRLKQEMLKERQRELDLRKQGKIYTISEERVGLERDECPSSNRSFHVEDSMMNSGGSVSREESEINLRDEMESSHQLQPSDFYGGDNGQIPEEFVVVENQRTDGGLPSWRIASELRIEEEVKEARRREKELREQRRLANETALTNQMDEQLQLHERQQQHQRNNNYVASQQQQHNRHLYRRT